GPKGDIAAQAAGEGGVLVCDIDLSNATADGHLADRRPELYGALAQGTSPAVKLSPRGGTTLRVAAAQMLSSFDVASNVTKMEAMLEEAHASGVRVVAFPEMAVTGYSKEASLRETLNWEAIDEGLARLRAACDSLDMYAV